MRHEIMLNDKPCGGGVSLEVAMHVLMDAACRRAGHYKVVDLDGVVIIDLTVDRPMWSEERIADYEATQPMAVKHGWVDAEFWLESAPRSWPGFHCGQSWNGWCVPYFRREEVLSIMDCLCDEGPWEYELAGDGGLRVECPDQDLEPFDIFPEVGPEGELVWNLGGWLCWMEQEGRDNET